MSLRISFNFFSGCGSEVNSDCYSQELHLLDYPGSAVTRVLLGRLEMKTAGNHSAPPYSTPGRLFIWVPHPGRLGEGSILVLFVFAFSGVRNQLRLEGSGRCEHC